MQSIFDLAQSTDQLSSSNHGMQKDIYEQITPTRDVTGSNFPNGSINFRWQSSASKWWLPSKSYFRFRIKLSKANGNPLTQSESITDDIGPVMNQVSALFQSAEVRMSDKTVSRVSDYFPQIDTLNTRLNKSSSWINTVGKSTNWWESQFQVRVENVSRNGEVQGNVNSNLDRADLGFAPGNTIARDGASGIITFAGTGVPNVGSIFNVGDKLRVTNNVATVVEYVINRIINATQIGTMPGGGDIGVDTLGFSRIRDTNLSRQITEYEITWTPSCLSLFKVDHAIPAARMEVIMNPATSSVYKKACVESSYKPAEPGTEYDIQIQDMFLYIATVEGRRVENLTYYMDLEQISCQAENLNNALAFGQKSFDVSPSTRALCLAFQDTRAGTNTLFSPTIFRSYLPNRGVVPGTTNEDMSLRLNRLFLNYSSISKPQIDADPNFKLADPDAASGGVDRTTQRYVESLINSDSYNDTGGSETIEEWQRRGAYYLFNWTKDNGDRSTRCSVHTGFDPYAGATVPTNLTNSRMLLFSISSQICKVVIENGQITSVQLEDA